MTALVVGALARMLEGRWWKKPRSLPVTPTTEVGEPRAATADTIGMLGCDGWGVWGEAALRAQRASRAPFAVLNRRVDPNRMSLSVMVVLKKGKRPTSSLTRETLMMVVSEADGVGVIVGVGTGDSEVVGGRDGEGVCVVVGLGDAEDVSSSVAVEEGPLMEGVVVRCDGDHVLITDMELVDEGNEVSEGLTVAVAESCCVDDCVLLEGEIVIVVEAVMSSVADGVLMVVRESVVKTEGVFVTCAVEVAVLVAVLGSDEVNVREGVWESEELEVTVTDVVPMTVTEDVRRVSEMVMDSERVVLVEEHTQLG